MAEPVYYFFRGDLHDVELFASRRYICVAGEGPKENLFDPEESRACNNSAMQPIYGT